MILKKQFVRNGALNDKICLLCNVPTIIFWAHEPKDQSKISNGLLYKKIFKAQYNISVSYF